MGCDLLVEVRQARMPFLGRMVDVSLGGARIVGAVGLRPHHEVEIRLMGSEEGFPQQKFAALRQPLIGFQEIPSAAQLIKQRGKIVVTHGRMRQESNDFPEASLGLGSTTQLSGHQSSKVVQRGITRLTSQCSIYFCECLVSLSLLQ